MTAKKNSADKQFIQLIRSDSLITLFKHPYEFTLLSLIAYRARREACRFTGLQAGQALIGDYKACGLTEQKYRTAKLNIQRWGFATFKATSRGTIATLCCSGIYDINSNKSNRQPNEQATDNLTNRQRTANEQLTTNNNDNNDNNEEECIKKENKKSYGEDGLIKLSDKEYYNLLNGFGELKKKYDSVDSLLSGIDRFEAWAVNNPAKFKKQVSHYKTMQGWVYDKMEENENQPKQKSPNDELVDHVLSMPSPFDPDFIEDTSKELPGFLKNEN